MPQFSKKRTSFCCKKYFKRKSYIAVQAAFRQQLNHTLPCKKTIQQNVNKYRSHEMNLNKNKKILLDQELLVLKRTLNESEVC